MEDLDNLLDEIDSLVKKINIYRQTENWQALNDLKKDILSLMKEAFRYLKSNHGSLDWWEKLALQSAIVCINVFPKFATLSLVEINHALTPRNKRSEYISASLKKEGEAIIEDELLQELNNI